LIKDKNIHLFNKYNFVHLSKNIVNNTEHYLQKLVDKCDKANLSIYVINVSADDKYLFFSALSLNDSILLIIYFSFRGSYKIQLEKNVLTRKLFMISPLLF